MSSPRPPGVYGGYVHTGDTSFCTIHSNPYANALVLNHDSPQDRIKMQSRLSNTRHHTESFLSERENRENIMNDMMGRWTRLGSARTSWESEARARRPPRTICDCRRRRRRRFLTIQTRRALATPQWKPGPTDGRQSRSPFIALMIPEKCCRNFPAQL